MGCDNIHNDYRIYFSEDIPICFTVYVRVKRKRGAIRPSLLFQPISAIRLS